MAATPKESLQSLKVRLEKVLDKLQVAVTSADGLSYGIQFTWYEEPYDLGSILGEMDSAVQSLENNVQMLNERD